MTSLARAAAALPHRAPLAARGRVVELTGLVARAALDGVRLGELCDIRGEGAPLRAEVVAFRGDEAVLLPLGDPRGLALGAEVTPLGRALEVRAGRALLGRVLDGLGQPIDGRPLPDGLARWAVHRPAPPPLARARVAAPLQLGIRALDALLTAGEGQRIGLFAGSGSLPADPAAGKRLAGPVGRNLPGHRPAPSSCYRWGHSHSR